MIEAAAGIRIHWLGGDEFRREPLSKLLFYLSRLRALIDRQDFNQGTLWKWQVLQHAATRSSRGDKLQGLRTHLAWRQSAAGCGVTARANPLFLFERRALRS
jgi:hypothetical protein